jgi:phosphoribosylanthranilate isomerase
MIDIKIKICGLKRIEDIDAVNQYKPDYIGFVFAPGKRQITPQQAMILKQNLSQEILAAGVFVNSSIEMITELAEENIIDLIQLHGDETVEYANSLKAEMQKLELKTGKYIPIIQVIKVHTIEDITENLLKSDSYPADYLLFDTYTKGMYGGSGTAFDWSLIPKVNKPWFLAGGIGISNIAEAKQTNAYCIDVSSSVETDGYKDPHKIEEIIKMIRSK